MKEEYSTFCLFIIGLTLLVGTALTNFNEVSVIIYFFSFYYFMCFFFLKRLTQSTHFLESFGAKRFFKKKQVIILAGNEQKNETAQNQKEDRYLSIFEPGRAINIFIITWALFIGGTYIFYALKATPTNWATLLSLANSFLIINSFFIGHLLVALMINLLLVIGYYTSSFHIAFYILYAFMQISSLYLMSLSEKKDNQVSTFNDRKKYLSFFIIALTFVILAISLSSILPEKINLSSNEKRERTQKKKFLGKLSQTQTQLEDLSSELTESESQNSDLENNQNLSSQVDSQIRKIKDIKSQMRKSSSSFIDNPDMEIRASEAIREGEIILKDLKQKGQKSQPSPSTSASATNSNGLVQTKSIATPAYSRAEKEQVNNLKNLASPEGLQSSIDQQKEAISNLEKQLTDSTLSESQLQDMKRNLQAENEKMESLLSGKAGQPIKLAENDKNALKELAKKMPHPEMKDLMERDALTQSQMKEISKAIEQSNQSLNSQETAPPAYSKEEKEQLNNLKNLASPEGLQSSIDQQKEAISNLEKQLTDSSLSESQLQDMKRTLQAENEKLESLLSGKADQPIKLAENDKNALKELAKKMPNPEMKDLMEREALTQSQMKEISEAIDNTFDLSKESSDSSRESSDSSKESSDSSRESSDGHSGSESPIFNSEPKTNDNNSFELIKENLPIIIVIILIGCILYRFKKRGIKKVELDDPKVLEELQKKWSSIKKLRLSPREEIIVSYNFFHDSLQRIHYQHESPPSCIIYTDLSEISPELEKSTLSITDIFANVFYGNKEITKENLELFRKGMRKFLKFYQLS
jgi:hypothetical protein